MLKKILIGLLVVLVVIQFFPVKKNNGGSQAHTIGTAYPVPENVAIILKKSCYDCHSNTTTYPWYSRIQPVGWWLNHHVDEGKEHLNFSEFTSYPAKKQAHKLEEVAETVDHNEMPLNSYLWIHTDARLTPQEKQTLMSWASQLQHQIELQ